MVKQVWYTNTKAKLLIQSTFLLFPYGSFLSPKRRQAQFMTPSKSIGSIAGAGGEISNNVPVGAKNFECYIQAIYHFQN
jgi:hypothetical protein